MRAIKYAFDVLILVLLLSLVAVMPVIAEEGSQLPAVGEEIKAQSEMSSSNILGEATRNSDPATLAMAPESTEDKAELQDLLKVLQEETEVATKTRMNNDYVPGMVTVLRGDQLEALGIRTAAEALTLVPGIQLGFNASGSPSAKVRGFQFPFNAGNIKVLLNSIPLSRESSGINSSVLLIPIEQVDRIEVIRGPGSSLYGDFAMTGVVNIITRDNGGRVFGVIGDGGVVGGGGNYKYQNAQNSFGAGLNIAVMDGGNNAGAQGTNPDEKRLLPIARFKYKGFSLIGEGVFRDMKLAGPPSDGSAPGGGPPPPGAPPPPAPGKPDFRERSWAIEGRQIIELGRNADAEAHLSFLRNSWHSGNPVSEFQGNRVEAGLDVHWRPWTNHQLLLGLLYSYDHIENAVNHEPGSLPVEISGAKRTDLSLNLQDQIKVSDKLAMTLGVRFDDYDDVGKILTPRVALVYRLAERHLIKAQYSEGFRAPTFWELYATGSVNNSLDFEVLRTGEFSYIYRRPKATGKVTLYYSKIGDGIYKEPDHVFGNNIDIESKGVEVEWEQQISEKLRVLANVSYNDTRDDRTVEPGGKHAIGVADWLGNLAFFIRPLPKFMVTGRMLYVGDSHTSEGWIDGYKSVDLTVSRMDLLKKGLTLRAGVKNVLNDDIIYVTSLPEPDRNVLTNEFRGRSFWVQLSYEF